MNWKLIAEHFADGTIDRENWRLSVWDGGVAWEYIGDSLHEPIDKRPDTATAKHISYGYPGSIAIELLEITGGLSQTGPLADQQLELYTAIKALGIPVV